MDSCSFPESGNGDDEFISQTGQFIPVQLCQPHNGALTFAGELHFDNAFVVGVGAPLDQSERFATRDQRDHAMVFGLQTLSQFADRGMVASGESGNLQQQQILCHGDAVTVADIFAEAKETPQLVAEFGQLFEVCLGQCAGFDGRA